MTKADELNALADRCEREEASRTLDVAILRAVEGRPASKYDPNLPLYTDSLDAAVSLVPEGMFVAIDIEPTGKNPGGASISDNRGRFLVNPDMERYGRAQTPALALCAAALRARAALSQTDGAEPDKAKVRTP